MELKVCNVWHVVSLNCCCCILLNSSNELFAGNDDSAERETMLQALRGIITPAGDKMTEPLRKQIHATLITMLAHPEDVTRSAAGGCLGAMCRFLSAEQLDETMQYLLAAAATNDDVSDDLRHGKSAALYVAIKEAATVVYVPKYENKICKSITGNIVSDRVSIASNAIRGAGYLLTYCMLNEQQTLPAAIIGPFVRAMNHASNEVKQILAKTCNFLAKNVPAEKVPAELLKVVIPMLVNGTKEKNGYVKSNSEISLISVLRLRDGEDTYQKCLAVLETGARESLSEVVTKVLRRAVVQAVGKEEELDDTILS